MGQKETTHHVVLPTTFKAAVLQHKLQYEYSISSQGLLSFNQLKMRLKKTQQAAQDIVLRLVLPLRESCWEDVGAPAACIAPKSSGGCSPLPLAGTLLPVR